MARKRGKASKKKELSHTADNALFPSQIPAKPFGILIQLRIIVELPWVTPSSFFTCLIPAAKPSKNSFQWECQDLPKWLEWGILGCESCLGFQVQVTLFVLAVAFRNGYLQLSAFSVPDVLFLLRKATPVTSFLHSMKSPNVTHCSSSNISYRTKFICYLKTLHRINLHCKKNWSINLVIFIYSKYFVFTLANLHHNFFVTQKKPRISCEHHGYFTQ